MICWISGFRAMDRIWQARGARRGSKRETENCPWSRFTGIRKTKTSSKSVVSKKLLNENSIAAVVAVVVSAAMSKTNDGSRAQCGCRGNNTRAILPRFTTLFAVAFVVLVTTSWLSDAALSKVGHQDDRRSQTKRGKEADPVIEEVTAKQLERLLNERDFVAVYWCKFWGPEKSEWEYVALYLVRRSQQLAPSATTWSKQVRTSAHRIQITQPACCAFFVYKYVHVRVRSPWCCRPDWYHCAVITCSRCWCWCSAPKERDKKYTPLPRLFRP